MALRVLTSGVDRLELSIRGPVRHEVLKALEVAKLEAQRMREAEPFQFAGSERRFLVQASGRRAYPYVLLSPDFGLTVRGNGELPPVRADILSAYLHEVGAEKAAAELGGLVAEAVFVVPPDVVVSRVDVYADVQGWELELTDARRFVSRARHRTAYTVGQRFTGLVFGPGGPLLARVYDKTAEIEGQGKVWLAERWGERNDERPVWRVELQVRRRVLSEFGARSPGEVLRRLPNLWQHGTREFLTLRRPMAGRESWRWPVDETWAAVQGAVVGSGVQGVRRERRTEMHRDRVVRFLQGGLTTLGALAGVEEIDAVLVLARQEAVRYLGEQGRTFRDEVRHKRSRLLFVAGMEQAAVSPPGEGAPVEGRAPGEMPGEAGGAHPPGSEENGDGRGGDRECAGAAVGVEPPKLPGGSERNRIVTGRYEADGDGRSRRRRVRDGGDGGGSTRQRAAVRRSRNGRRGRAMPGRVPPARRSASSAPGSPGG